MPTRRITRALRRPGGPLRPRTVAESASLLDFLNAMLLHDVSILPVSHQVGREILGRGLSGSIHQSSADAETVLAFKQGVPSKRDRDDDQNQDWYSLVTEITVLRHPPIRDNHHIIDVLGVAFSTDAGPGPEARAWPQLVTRRANMGSMESLLTNTDKALADGLRWQLFAEVMEAIYLLHACGVAHGDIKPNNFVVDRMGDEINCELIDFGSCVIRGQDRHPTLNPPWNAPELGDVTRGVGFDYLAQADLYSLCLLCVHILLPLEALRDVGLCFLREQQWDAEWERVIADLERAKSPHSGPHGLATRIIQATSHSALPSDQKDLLDHVVRSTIIPPHGSRFMPWDEVFRLTKAHLSINFSTDGLSSVEPPPLAFSSILAGHEKHAKFSVKRILGDLDDSHYVVRRTIMRNVEYKAQHAACSECRQRHAFTLAICCKIGLGCLKDDEMCIQWLRKAERSQADLDAAVDRIGEEYQGTNKMSKHVLEQLSIGVLQTSDRVSEYQVCGQLSEAETCLRNEVDARTTVFKTKHRCLARLSGELAQVFRKQDRLEEAAEQQKTVVDILETAYGTDHPSSIMARLTLADIWTDLGFLRKAKSLQETDVPLLKQVLGAAHPDALVAMQFQSNTLASEGNLDEAEDIVRDVIAIRSKLFDRGHPLTVNAEINLATILRANGHLNKAVDVIQGIERKLIDVLEDDRMREFQLYLSQALLYKDMWLLDTAMQKIRKVHSVVDRMRVDSHHGLRLMAYEVEASIHHAGHRMDQEEALLRNILAVPNPGAQANEVLRTRISVLLARNLLWQGRHGEAYMVAEEVVTSLGPSPLVADSTSYVACMETAANALDAQGQRAAAEQKILQSYEACLAEFGEGHSTTVDSVCSLAALWNSQRQFSKSQGYLEGILSRLRPRPGKLAGQVARQLAVVYLERGLLEKALNLCNEAEKWASAAGGESHHDTLAVLNILARVHLRLGRPDEAEKILVQINSQCRDSRLAGYIKQTLRQVRSQQGRRDEALELAREAEKLLLKTSQDPGERTIYQANVLRERLGVEGFTDDLERAILENIRKRGVVQGERSPGRIAMMADLAYWYGISGRLTDAKNFFDQIEELGGINEQDEPIEEATLLGKKADICFRLGRFADAEVLERRALIIRERVYEEGHDAVLTTKSNLATTLNALSKHSEAESLLREVLAARKDHVGQEAENPAGVSLRRIQSLLRAEKDLASVLFLRGKLLESLALFEDALEHLTTVGGPLAMMATLADSVQLVREKMAQEHHQTPDAPGDGDGDGNGDNPVGQLEDI